METSGTPSVPPVQPGPPSSVSPKKGLGTGAKIGIGCGAIVLLGVIAAIVAAVLLGGKVKEFADEAQKNPTRATANMMVSVSGGALEMVAQDDENKRYTIREKRSGALTTVYWNEQKKAPDTITGDFSAIPTETAPEPAPVPEAGQH